jgi:hypothetical protein
MNFHGVNKIYNLQLPRKITDTWKTQRMGIAGQDPLEVKLVDCFQDGAWAYPFRVLA